MATRKISTRLAIEGESTYKPAIRDCNNEIRTMCSELTLIQNRYQTNANGMKAQKQKAETLYCFSIRAVRNLNMNEFIYYNLVKMFCGENQLPEVQAVRQSCSADPRW